MADKLTKRQQKERALDKIKDPILSSFMIDLWDFSLSRSIKDQPVKKLNTLTTFCDKIKDCTPADINWDFLCCIVDEDPAYGYPCMRLLYYLLSNNLYSGDYKQQLNGIKECFNIRKEGLQERWYKKYFVHDDIQYVCYSENLVQRRLFFIRTDNVFLFDLLKQFCFIDRGDKCTQQGRGNEALFGRDWFWDNISLIFGKYESTLQSVWDFNYSVFRHMESNCIKYAPVKDIVLRKVYRFFVFLIESFQNENLQIFQDSDPMDYTALKRDDLAKRTLEGFKYIYYNPNNPVPDGDRWILHINGFEKGTTKLKSTATKLYDFTRINSLFYRDLAKSYFWNESRCNFNTKYEHYILLIDSLNKLSDMKRKNGVPEDRISINETSSLRLWINNKASSVSARTQHIIVLREFLFDLQSEGKLGVEYFALDYLKQFGNAQNKNAHAIPEADLEKLNAVMMWKAGESLQNSYCYTILHILLQTEFRVSQVCHLKTGCVLPTVNKNQFLLTRSKTSHGQDYEAVITDFTKSLLDDVELLSKEVRENCTSDENRDYLFLYQTTENQYVPVSGRYFREYMVRCCDEAKIPRYTPSNIRDFHMTKAEEENLRKGYSDMRLKTLSGHAHVDTTRNHYIETKLTQIIEAMYGIVIGNVDLAGNIVDTIPEHFNSKRNTVEGGCGQCGLISCMDNAMVSCLLCKDFYTTVENLPHFKAMMRNLDGLIKDKKWEHDKEDLVNKKRLVAAYILAIEMRIAETEGVT